MAKTKNKTENTGIDLIEKPEEILSKTEEFFSDKKNKTLVFGLGGIIAFLIVGFMSYSWYISTQNKEAQEEMFQAVYYFEKDSLGLALNGDGNNYGFLDIIQQYSGTSAANLSNFYVGAIYMKLADFDNAIRYLKNYSSDDILIQGRAFSLIGDAYMELDDFENAIGAYQKAADYKTNAEFTPVYLGKLALAQEKAGKLKDASDSYTIIIEKYVKSSLVQEAQKQKARVEGLIQD